MTFDIQILPPYFPKLKYYVFYIFIIYTNTKTYKKMSEEEKSDRSDQVDNGFGDFEDGQDLFKDIVVENEQKEQPPKKHKKLKKMKKEKKSKKQKKQKKKKRRHEQQEEEQYGDGDGDEEDEQIDSMFEDQAQSDQNSEQYSVDESAEIGQDDQNRRFNELMNKPRTIGNYFKKFDGKKDDVINAMYSRGVNMLRQSEAMYPAQNDPKIFVIHVRPRHQDQIVIFLLNKARHLAETTEKVLVVTATAMKKKFAGKIFVQAFSEKDVRDALEHLPNVSLTKNLQQLDREGYAELFNQKYEQKIDFKEENFVQIKKGLYEDDLAQIIRIRANSADVIVVPRLNVKQIAKKIHEHTSKISDETKRRQKMAELLTLFLDHKAKNYKQRPPKKNLSQQQLRQQLGDNPACKKIRLSGHPPGLIILNYKFDEIAKHSGTYNPIQFLPFTTTEGNFIAKMNEEKGHLTTVTNFKKGEEVEIISGSMIGHFGVIYEVKDNIAVITCKNKELFNQKIEEPVENIVKKFKEGQRVKVISGADIGKTGTVLKIQQKVVQMWTDNQNSIRVNKKNLQVSTTQIICTQNVHNLTKHDLIKTTKNQIGIVLQTTKDNIKILDTNNTIQIIGNLDFDSKLNTRNIVAKNRTGDQVGAGCIVIIRSGANQGKKCKVIHVYRQNVFLFNAGFNRTAGIAVQSAENCSLMSKNQAPQQRSFSTKGNQSSVGATDSNKDQITIGKSIILRTGPLKGYQGIVKSINKDKIEVRVLSKACTQWVPRENVTTKQEAMEVGKTPNRRGGNTHAYAPSPSRL